MSVRDNIAQGFNCTFMELKCDYLMLPNNEVDSFNCTFMELKFKSNYDNLPLKTVLIVPLWN